MNIFYKGDPIVISVLGKKQIDPDTKYRWSIYAVAHHCDGKNYVFQNFTKQINQLNEETLEINPDIRFSASEIIASPVLKQLAEDSFLVPETKNEALVYENYCKLRRAMISNKCNAFTILPTTACNARCVYCYEAGIQFISMNDEIVDQTIRYIKSVCNPQEPVVFSWFGGEPLMGEKSIDKIVKGLKEEGIEVVSRMISNGSLITEEIIKKMRDSWNLRRIQITLDGVEEQYNARKNYVFNYQSAYWHVLSRIKMVNEAGIRVHIRINVDHENIGGVPTMIDDLKNFIVNPSLVSFDIAPLFDLQANENTHEIWDKAIATMDMITAKGFYVSTHFTLKHTRYHFCMADNPYNSRVITPDGTLYSCEHFQAMQPLGDIWKGVTETDLLKQLGSVEPTREMCRNCFALPNCTTYSRCPNKRVDCAYSSRLRMERALDRFIRGYSAALNKMSDVGIEEDNDEDC